MRSSSWPPRNLLSRALRKPRCTSEPSASCDFVGVAIGSLLLALVESFGALYMRASLQNLIAFALLFVALVFMPGGVMSLVERWRK